MKIQFTRSDGVRFLGLYGPDALLLERNDLHPQQTTATRKRQLAKLERSRKRLHKLMKGARQ